MTVKQYNSLFRWSFRCLKYFVLALAGLVLAVVISLSFGGANIVVMLLPSIGDWVVRLGILVLFLVGIAILVESLR